MILITVVLILGLVAIYTYILIGIWKDPRPCKSLDYLVYAGVAAILSALCFFAVDKAVALMFLIAVGALFVTEGRKARWVAERIARLEEVRKRIRDVEAEAADPIEHDLRAAVERSVGKYWNLKELRYEEEKLLSLNLG